MAQAPQIVLITGATAGIGRHAALHLARRGHRVFASGRRPEALAKLAADAAREGVKLETVVLDVTDAGSIAAAARVVEAATGGAGPDVLVNNAGYGQMGPLELVSDADLRKQFETNVFGLHATTLAFLPGMRRKGGGRIINVSSVGGRFTFPLGGAYHATKYAVEAMSDALRIEVAPFGIDVVVVEPGAILTEFSERAMDTAAPYADDRSPYAPFTAKAQALKTRVDKMSAGPEVIARVLERAIESRRPRARYVAPFSAKLMLGVLGRLPTRFVDWMFLRSFKLSRGSARAVAAPPASPSARAA
ncbi:MAG: SDR family NAD(P)-dependent oxidoreductase [Myxococcota bacterium]